MHFILTGRLFHAARHQYEQEAQLSHRDCTILRVCLSLASTAQYLKCSLLLLVTSASDLPTNTIKFCSLLFGISIKACCHKHDSLMHDISSTCHDKQTLLLSAITVLHRRNVDDTRCSRSHPDPKAKYLLKTTIFAQLGGVPVRILP